MEDFEEKYAKLREVDKKFIEAYLETFDIKEAGRRAGYRYPKYLFPKLYPYIKEKAKLDMVNGDFFNSNNIMHKMRELFENTQDENLKLKVLQEALKLCVDIDNTEETKEVVIRFE